jgi:hypothetical protein
MEAYELKLRTLMVKINIGLMAISFSFFLALLQVSALDIHLTRVLYSCCIIFPLSSIFGYLLQTLDGESGKKLFQILRICTFITTCLAGGSLVELVGHFSQTASVILTITTIFSMLLFVVGLDYRSKKKSRSDKDIIANRPISKSNKVGSISEDKGSSTSHTRVEGK